MDENPQVWEQVQPEGLARTLFAFAVTSSIITAVIVLLRGYTRTTNGLNGVEDYLMYVGGILNVGHNAAIAYGCFTGIGTHDGSLNIPTMIEGAKMVTMWQLLYVLASPFIKISICATLIRVAVQRRYTYPLYAVSFLTVAMTIMAVVVVFIQCVPFQASWTGEGRCISIDVIIIPTYLFSAVNVLVDWTVATVPVFVLWNLQLRKRLKQLAFGILAVGVLASIATIIRMPYVRYYAAESDKLYKLAFVILWTVVELTLGIVAGCLPSLRKLFKNLSNDKSSRDQSSVGTGLVTIGRRSKNRIQPSAPYDCELNTTVQAGRDGSSDGMPDKDDDSTRRIIHVTRDVVQTSH